MKKQILMGVIAISLLQASESKDPLSEILLNTQKSTVLDKKENYYKSISSQKSTSWIRNVNLTMSRSFVDGDYDSDSYSASYNQPIYMGGNIINTIVSSKKEREINLSIVDRERDSLIYSIIAKMLQIKRMDLRENSIKLSLKSNEIDLKRKKRLYKDGILDITFVSDLIIRQNSIKNQLIDIVTTKELMKKELKLLTPMRYEDLKNNKSLFSYVKLIGKEEFIKNNYINIEKEKIKLADLQTQRTKNSLWPTVSMGLSANKYENDYTSATAYNSSVSVSMPISINNYKEVEVAKVNSMVLSSSYDDRLQEEEVFWENKIVEISSIDDKMQNIKGAIKEYEGLIEILEKDLELGLSVACDLELLKINRDLKVSEKNEQLNAMAEKTLEMVSHTKLRK